MLYFNSFCILPLKCETCFPRFKQSLHLAGRSWVVLWQRHVTKRTCIQREREKERDRDGEGRKRPWPVLSKALSGGFLRFTTFLIIWNSLSTANKGRKMSLPCLSFIWIDSENVAQRHVASLARAPGGDGILSLPASTISVYVSTF